MYLYPPPGRARGEHRRHHPVLARPHQGGAHHPHVQGLKDSRRDGVRRRALGPPARLWGLHGGGVAQETAGGAGAAAAAHDTETGGGVRHRHRRAAEELRAAHAVRRQGGGEREGARGHRARAEGADPSAHCRGAGAGARRQAGGAGLQQRAAGGGRHYQGGGAGGAGDHLPVREGGGDLQGHHGHAGAEHGGPPGLHDEPGDRELRQRGCGAVGARAGDLPRGAVSWAAFAQGWFIRWEGLGLIVCN
mmetsp:Transcript_23183/g.72418  ORF Transcript_23183/g.72418 Transcript_23183/m.72418 type:complete len:248 (+) Transcript_23183:1589-2332(+)